MDVKHLGTEQDDRTMEVARHLLIAGQKISFVGLGHSMHPIIRHGTRMVFEPFDHKTQQPVIGDTYFGIGLEKVKGQWFYYFNTHMCLSVTRRRILLGCADGTPLGWVNKENIFGRYIGDWKELCRQP